MTSAKEYDEEFRRRAERKMAWGRGLFFVTGALWVWFAYLLMMPYETDGPGSIECESVLFGDEPLDGCPEARPWSEMLGLLAVSLPVAIAGAGLYVTGHVTQTMSSYRRAVEYFEAESAGDTARG
ncbi:hypothetical protein ACQUSR_11180 [Streptomyces sp. P1-3]|uniref:hypothetical protein n=1 Tax=Streptomyces sp. P1-3 TaxID=3421658 RepID=UPI003D369B1B